MIASKARHSRTAFECVPNECGISDVHAAVAGCLDELGSISQSSDL